jgi:hypothetical protein
MAQEATGKAAGTGKFGRACPDCMQDQHACSKYSHHMAGIVGRIFPYQPDLSA